MNTKEDLKDKIRKIPELPGIYRMLDSNGSIIYIGKSKCLKKRVQTYFVNSPKWEKVTRMVTMIKDIEYTVTDTHLEARLLECKLIKFHQPIFNAQLKNDKRYIYLKIDTYNPHHTMSIVSQRTENCYGPFRGHYAMKDFLDNLKSIYPLSKCNENFVIEYHLFPQTLDKASFEVNRNILLDLFSDYNNITNLIAALQDKLIEAADQYRYELASLYRDLIQGFKVIQNGLNRHHTLSTRNILLKLPTTKGFKLFYISKSQIINSHELTRISSKTIDKFIKDSLMRLDTFETDQLNEKASIDFRDILYSEIMSLPEDMVELL